MSAAETFDLELRRLDALIERELRRMRARYELSVDEFHGLYITDARVDELVRAAGPDHTPPREVPEVRAARAADAASRWAHLARSLEVNDDERDVLLVCLAPELDPKYETLYAYLNDDVTRRWPTIDLIERVLGAGPGHRTALRGSLLPGCRLLSCCAVEFVNASRELARARRALRAAPPLRDWLMGLPYADDRLLGVARFGAFEALLPDRGIPREIRDTLTGLSRLFGAGTRTSPIVLSAATPSEASMFAEDVFGRAGRLALVLDLMALRSVQAPDEVINAVELAQRVLGVGVVASPLDALVEADGRPIEAPLPAVRRFVRRSSALILASGPAVRRGDVMAGTQTIDIQVPELSAAERAATWRWALARQDATSVGDAAAVALADRFVLGVDRVLRAVESAAQQASLAGHKILTETALFAAARMASIADSAGTTQRVATVFDWDDLVLPSDIKQRLADVIHAISLRGRVLDEWGFARRIGGARGVRILLAGPSGTGKSTAAAIIAKTLQLDLHRIELGTVVSKYIGETEKNLDRAFSAARQANAILFIDEADALLGKRSQVKDAHDRYANVEVAYLLQKMEDHDGIVIVATNLAQNIDEAFSRRIQYAIHRSRPTSTSVSWRVSSSSPVETSATSSSTRPIAPRRKTRRSPWRV